MSAFITQLIDDQPTVLVISPTPTPPKIQAGWMYPDLAIEFSTPEAFLSLHTANKPSYFRIVLWVPDKDDTPLSTWQKSIHQAQTLVPRVSVVLTHNTQLKSSHSVWKKWQNTATHHVQLLDHFKRNEAINSSSQSLQWILGQDVIDTEWEPGRSMISSISQEQLMDPQVVVYPQTIVGFWRAVFSVILDPTTTSTVLRGKKTSTTTILQRLRLELYRKNKGLPEVVALPAEIDESWLQWPITTLQTSFISEELLIETLLNQITTLTPSAAPRLTPRSSSTTAVSPPPQRPMVIPPTQVTQRTSVPKSVQSTRQPLTSHTPAFTPSTPPSVVTSVTPSVDQSIVMETKVTKLFQESRQDNQEQRFADREKKAQKTVKKTKHRKKIFVSGLMAGVAGVVVLVLYTSFWLSSRLLMDRLTPLVQSTRLATLLNSGDTITELPSLLLENVVTAQINIAQKIVSEELTTHQANLIAITQSLREYLEAQQRLHLISQDVLRGFTTTEPPAQEASLATQLSKISTIPQEMYHALSTLEESLQQSPLSGLSPFTPFTTLFTSAKKNLTTAQLLQPMWPVLLGVETTRVYAVIWQNSLELRPTGGFIQAVALITVENGQVIDLQTLTSDEVDQRIPGQIEPPAEIASLLGENDWYFRDSNWSPDFPEAAQQMRKYLDKITPQPVDGVIALTTPSVGALLEVTGPIYVSQLSTSITSENITHLIEKETQEHASQDQLLAKELLNSLIQQVVTKGPEQASVLLNTLQTQFSERTMLLALRDANEEATFKAIGWVGSLAQPLCPTQLSTAPCLIETVTQNEANVGVNLANSRLQRQVAHQVVLTATQATHIRQISLHNASTSKTWPLGDYKAYIRLFVSPTASLSGLILEGQNVPLSEVKISTGSATQVWGWTVVVPPQTQKTIEVHYSTPLRFDQSTKNFSYGLLSQYQPGITPVVTTTALTYPDSWLPTLIAPAATVTTNQLQFISLPSLMSLQAAQFSLP